MTLSIYSTEDQAEGQLLASILAGDLSLTLNSSEGDEFPQPIIGAATSGGDAITLNSTGIQAKNVAVGDFVENVTDGSLAIIVSVSTDSVTTTTLRGGSGNTWDNSDEWAINRFVGTLQERSVNASGVITVVKEEKVLIGNRVGDIFTITTRGFDGSSATGFSADDYLVLNVMSLHHESLKEVIADTISLIQILSDTKADSSVVNALFERINWKNSCIALAASDVDISTELENGDVIDTVTLSTNDRVLLIGQTLAKQNGIYVVQASGAAVRSDDFNATAEISAAVVGVEKGTGTNENSAWFCTSDDVVIDTDDIDFVSFGVKNISDADAAILTGGGKADDQHIHDRFKQINNDTNVSHLLELEELDYTSTTVDVGIATAGSTNVASATFSNDSGTATAYLQASSGSQLWSSGQDVEISFMARFTKTGAATTRFACLGLFETTSDAIDEIGDVSDALIRIAENSAGSLRFQTSNNGGSSQTDEEVTGITASNWNHYRIVFEAGVDAKLYVNGVLKNTITTTLPTGTAFMGHAGGVRLFNSATANASTKVDWTKPFRKYIF